MAEACPVCQLGAGFHDRKIHDETVRVPAHLTIKRENR
jgi:hypothetical protein